MKLSEASDNRQGRAALLFLCLVENVAGEERRSKTRATGVEVALRL